MKYEQDEYGYYEKHGDRRKYVRIRGERAERWIEKGYPQQLDNKRYPPYRNYLILEEFKSRLTNHSEYATIEEHIEDALDRSLPLPVRRMHYDIIGRELRKMSFETDEEKNLFITLWKRGGGT